MSKAKVMREYPEGMFCGVDVVAHDLEAAKRWYAELFGWPPVDQDTQGGPPYVMFMKDGHGVAGAGQMSEQMRAAGVPPLWTDYVAVRDCAALEARARELGATINVPTMQVLTSGKMCFLQDPEGAGFAMWEAQDHHGAGLVNGPGCFCWNELATRDDEAARNFYAELFGWTYAIHPMGEGRYSSVKLDGAENGGMLQMAGKQWEGVPPHWATYFTVEDIAKSVAWVEAHGGSVVVPATALPGVGTFSIVRDSQGGMLTLLEMAS